MSQVSPKLRRGTDRYFHWCPGCNNVHPLPDGWTFNGDLLAPTFTPSFKHEGGRFKWGTDESEMFVCHYVLTAGVLNFCSDCTHALANKSVPLPDLPPELCDPSVTAP